MVTSGALQGFTWEILTLFEGIFCVAGNSGFKGQRWVIVIASVFNSRDYESTVNDGIKIFCRMFQMRKILALI